MKKNNVLCVSKQNNILKRSYQTLTMAFVSVLTFLMTSAYGFAATDLATAIKNICTKIGTTLTSILGPVCVLVLGFAIFSIIVGKNSKSAETGMDWAKRAIIGFIIFNLLGTILTYGIGLFSGTQQWGATSAMITLPQIL